MTKRTDLLYDLLPAIYRQRDIERGSPLRALFAAFQDQYDLLESDIASLYDDWFVETCEPWVLPYIGDLVGAGRLARRMHPTIDTRSLVANTLAYRRRKGTQATLEQAAAQATGWPARVVEARALTAMTYSVTYPATTTPKNVDFRNAAALAGVVDSFDTSPRTATIRSGGANNLDQIGLCFWRLQSYPLRQIDAAVIMGHPERRSFHPLGLDTPLFNRRLSRAVAHGPITRRNLPLALRRAELAQDLEALKSTGQSSDSFFSDPPAFSISIERQGEAAREVLDDMVIADLAHWRRPQADGVRIAVDPELGRMLLLRAEDHSASVRTDHCVGFPDDLGGGCYARAMSPTVADRLDRRAWLDDIWTGAPEHGADASADPLPETAFDLSAQVTAWRAQSLDGIIEIPDSRTYATGRTETDRENSEWLIDLRGHSGRHLAIRAAENQRPCLTGGLHIIAGANGGTLLLDGLMIGGALRIEGVVTIVLRHCTIVAPAGAPAITTQANANGPATPHVIIQSSLVGPIRLPTEGAQLELRNSIVNGGDSDAISGGTEMGPQTRAETATFAGPVRVQSILASDSMFLGSLEVADIHAGYVRYSLALAGSRMPLDSFRCALSDAAKAPRFVSRQIGQPGYFYFAPDVAAEILTGASNGMAFGAFRDVGDAVRRDNYADTLTEYLPYGLQVVTSYAT